VSTEVSVFPPEEIRAEVEELMGRYPPEHREAALIPLLHKVQRVRRCISDETAAEVAEFLGVPEQRVLGVVTFYTMFFRRPVGKYVIWHCKTLSCHLRGAPDVLEAMKKKLGIGVGETTTDGKFTLMQTECLGLCDLAPAILINDERYEHLTPESVVKILEELS
jgi:NADH-quinone oxidoreductase E subunit